MVEKEILHLFKAPNRIYTLRERVLFLDFLKLRNKQEVELFSFRIRGTIDLELVRLKKVKDEIQSLSQNHSFEF